MSISSVSAIDQHVTPSQETGPTGKATASLVLGILSIFGALVPLIGLPLSIVGLVMASRGMRSSRAGQARAGLVLSLVGIALSAIVFVVGVAVAFNSR
jgi:hypothetical protein